MLVRGGNSVSLMGESVFLWRLRSPSHLNQLFCNLHDSWIEFSAFLELHLLKRRTTVVLSDLLSRTYAGVEPIDLSRTYLRQTSHHLCAYFKINRFDELSSTKIRRLPRPNILPRCAIHARCEWRHFFFKLSSREEWVMILSNDKMLLLLNVNVSNYFIRNIHLRPR